MKILGHRGASALCPENTLAAFARAVADGADGVELDVRSGGAGALVVCHDPRLADGRLVAATAAADLPPEVPTLDVVLAEAGWWLNIEIKNDPAEPGHDPTGALARRVVAAVAGARAGARVLISSFDGATLDQVRSADPALAVGWLVAPGGSRPGPGLIDRAVARGCRALHPADALADAGLVAEAHRAGLEVVVWTVDDPARLRQLAALGVDAVITNDPGAARAALGP